MSVVRKSSSEFHTTNGDGDYTAVDKSHNIPVGTTLSILTLHNRAHISLSEEPSWNGSEDLVLVNDTGADAGDDPRTWVYKLINPTAGTFNIDYTWGTINDHFGHVLINYSGTSGVVNVLDEDLNHHPSSGTTGVHSSFGTTGATGLIAAAHSGFLSDPVSNNASFDEIAEVKARDDGLTVMIYVADKIGGLPTAVTVTWDDSDQNNSTYLEILPAIPNKIIQLNRSIQRASYI